MLVFLLQVQRQTFMDLVDYNMCNNLYQFLTLKFGYFNFLRKLSDIYGRYDLHILVVPRRGPTTPTTTWWMVYHEWWIITFRWVHYFFLFFYYLPSTTVSSCNSCVFRLILYIYTHREEGTLELLSPQIIF